MGLKALGFIGLLYNPILIFIAIFVYLAALQAESQNAPVRDVSSSLLVGDVMVRQYATPPCHATGQPRRRRRGSPRHQPARFHRSSLPTVTFRRPRLTRNDMITQL